VLGYIDPAHFLAGRMRLDRDAAEAAIKREIADKLGQSVEFAAAAIIELVNEHMVQAILDITLAQGIDPMTAVFVAGGGAAGLGCVAIGRRLGCKTILVPETGAALAAAGALVSDLTSHHQAMFHTTSRDFDIEGVNAVLETLEAHCRVFQKRIGSDAEFVATDWTTEARYPDQAWEIEVPLRQSRVGGKADVDDLVDDFHRTHLEIFAVNDPSSHIETIGWNATIKCRVGSPRIGRIRSSATPGELADRRVYFAEAGWIMAKVYRFERLEEKTRIDGPAIIESDFTSIVIELGARAWRDANGRLEITICE
jgi:N-methylhydantoinase A